MDALNVPIHKPNTIPHIPTIKNTAVRIFSFLGLTNFSFNKQIIFWKLLNYEYLNILNPEILTNFSANVAQPG
tara:strand:- start:12 stop:230 length:219 start_codon:yes stop_codon:yes gene_type:complete